MPTSLHEKKRVRRQWTLILIFRVDVHMGLDPLPLSTCVHLSLTPLRVDVINGWPLTGDGEVCPRYNVTPRTTLQPQAELQGLRIALLRGRTVIEISLLGDNGDSHWSAISLCSENLMWDFLHLPLLNYCLASLRTYVVWSFYIFCQKESSDPTII